MLDKRLDIYGLVGTTLKGRYAISHFIDEGGMGIVYKANDLKYHSEVAIKILPPRYLVNEERGDIYIKLFEREVTVLKKLRHPNIVSVIDNGSERGLVFIVMEWLEGCTLGAELLEKGRFSLDRTSFILNQICQALHAAHSQKIIHLDIKPNNIFLLNKGTPEEKVKVIDFGLSRIIQSTVGSTISRVVGTPQYMAPEVFENKASHLSDIYSLGVLTYEMLTGLLPFSQTQIYALIRQQLRERPPSARRYNEEVTFSIDHLIERALDKTPGLRPPSALDFAQDFSRSYQSPAYIPTDNTGQLRAYRPTVYLDNPFFDNRLRTKKASSMVNLAIITPYIFLIMYLSEVPYVNGLVLLIACFLAVAFVLYKITSEDLYNSHIHPFLGILFFCIVAIPLVAVSLIALIVVLVLVLAFLLNFYLIEPVRRDIRQKREYKKGQENKD